MLKRLLILTLIAGAQFLFAGKVAPDVPKSGGSTVIEVIVRFTHPPTKDDLKLLGPYGQIKKQLPIINGVHVALSLDTIQALQNNPAIAYISPNRSLKGSLDITTQAVNANLAWASNLDGTAVGVAVIDSGITQVPDLAVRGGIASRVVYSQSFIAGLDATDAYGHGTHVAGIIGSNGASSTGAGYSRTFKGVAPNVNLIDLRVLDQNGAGQEANVIAAIQTAISLQQTYNVRVLNLSLGRPVFESYNLDPLCLAAEAAWNAGIVVVTAAGNSGRDNSMGTHGYGTIAAPGNDPYVITVGATNSKGTPSIFDDSIASYSSKGPTLIDHFVKPDLVAPGNGVVSLLSSTNATLYTNFNSTRVSDAMYQTNTTWGKSVAYLRLSGTSMATPVVSGAAALLIQKNPLLTPDQVKARLMKTAAKILPRYMAGNDAYTGALFTNQANLFTVGAGYLDIAAALANNDLVTLPALSPVAIYNSLTKQVTISRNRLLAWGPATAFDASVVWGDALFSAQLGLINSMDTSVVWGDALSAFDVTDPGFSVVWGDTILGMGNLTAMSDDDSDQ